MSERSPILLVAYAGVLGGAERVLLDWAGALPGRVLLACPDGPLAATAAGRGVEVATLPPRPLRLRGGRAVALGALAGFARDVAALARSLRPRAVVASGQRPVLAAAALARQPVLALQHDFPAGPVLARAVRWATARADAVVAVSAAVARAVDPTGRATVVHPGVDLDHWRLAPPPPGGPARALVLGALVPWKRADLALEIAARVDGLEIELAGAPLPGDTPGFSAALRARAGRPDLAGRVTFAGALEDPRPALARAHCLLHCADREPYGLALVEALAAGRPVVAPAAGGPLEILGSTGAGRLYPPGDADAAARALRAALADPAAPAAARARAEAGFDGTAAARRFAAAVAALAPVRGLSTPPADGIP
jgi:glycosyltransferase involved in cell wall biosynthesis